MIGNFIAGEYSNTIISGTNSSIAGGRDNSIDKDYDFIGGGSGNVISGSTHSNIIGGEINKIETNIPSKGSRSSIVGGNNNNILYANFASIVGGAKNIIDGSENAFIGGGISGSIITSVNSFIGGGYKNIISGGSNNFIGGGNGNIIYKSNKSSIGGGDSNTITGNSNYSTIPGGFFNEINNAIYSFAVGVRAKANSNNSFVWNSDNGADFTSIKTGTFIINVPWGSRPDMGGMGINTNDPQALLDVNGTSVIRGSLNALGGINSTDIIASGKLKAEKTELEIWTSAVTSGGSCGSENPGTIIYDGVGFYGCGPSNTRKRLD